MSTMADILHKMYTQRETSVTSQPLRGKRPTGNKRSHAESEDSEQEPGQSESEESTTLERKRLRRRYSDDELSLEAGDSENDLAELKSSTQTSQGAGDIARRNHANGISPDDLAKSLADDNDDKSPDIQPKLVEAITKRWGKVKINA